MFTYAWALCIRTLNTSLFVPAVDEQVPGTLWEPRQGYELNEAGNGVAGEEILPAGLAAQNLPMNKWSTRSWPLIVWDGDERLRCKLSGFPYLRPTTWPSTTPNAVNTADDREMAPRRCLGALSPKYMGCTFMLIPVTETEWKLTCYIAFLSRI